MNFPKQRERVPADAANLSGLAAPAAKGIDAVIHPADIHPGVRFAELRERTGAVFLNRFSERHRGRAALGDASLGRIDDPRRGFQKVALELLKIGKQPLLGVHRVGPGNR